jgi:hypothetical protein
MYVKTYNPAMNGQIAKIASLVLCVMGLVGIQGCATAENRNSVKPWSQIGLEEYQSEQIVGPDLNYPP